MRMGFILLTALVLFTSQTLAQGRYDANWVFGENCGMEFLQNGTVLPFRGNSNGYTSFSTLSDKQGNLRLSISANSIINSSGDIISRGDSIKHYHQDAATFSAIFLPDPVSENIVWLFHLGEVDSFSCNFFPCLGLYQTKISIDEQLNYEVVTKNKLIYEYPLAGKVRAIQHANGKDWWIVAHRTSDDGTNYSSDYYLSMLLTENGIASIMQKSIGVSYSNSSAYWGQMTFNLEGTQLVDAITEQGDAAIFDFNRCNGEVENVQPLSKLSTYNVSGIVFSPNGQFLYFTEQLNFGNQLYQYDIASEVITILWTVNNSSIVLGFLEMGLDSIIYVGTALYPQAPDSLKHRLGLIEFPNLAGTSCSFKAFHLQLDTNCTPWHGLPNMPNYNLGTTSIYQADAGRDTSICQEDTTAKGVLIGTNPVAGVQYRWHNTEIDAADKNKSQLLVSPNQSTWYYLELSDTSIVGSCQNRLDSVLVEVSICAGIKAMDLSRVQVYPNPTHGQFQVHIPAGYGQLTFKLFSLPGKTVMTQVITENTSIDVSGIAPGVYLYQLSNPENRHQPTRNGKLVVE